MCKSAFFYRKAIDACVLYSYGSGIHIYFRSEVQSRL